MEIRELSKSELYELLDLYLDLHDEDESAPQDGTLDLVWDKIQENPDYYCLGVFVHKKLVSTCSLMIIPNLTRGCRPYALIENVVTHQSFRRKGYGKAILQHSLNLAWANNCYKVMLQTGRLNEETFQFYEQAGFNRHAKQAFVAKPKCT
tara:strand:- start:4998 stop:5447 length:450 start_codon:yes stop_codon:yes gene_type:complete